MKNIDTSKIKIYPLLRKDDRHFISLSFYFPLFLIIVTINNQTTNILYEEIRAFMVFQKAIYYLSYIFSWYFSVDIKTKHPVTETVTSINGY